jgi:AcrR family transcriptional regulator
MNLHIEISQLTSAGRLKVGRPRALTLEQIIGAALRLGLESFTMKGVAIELGVTVATLYKYVQDRDHLFRLAVDEAIAVTRLPRDRGQHWSDYVSEFASAIFLKLASDKLMLDRLVLWGIGLETELRLSEVFIEAMIARGFASEEAVRILELVGIAAFGAAVRTCCDAARAQRHGSLRHAIDEALLPFAPDEMPHVRAMPLTNPEDATALVRRMIAPVIAQIAMSRGESVPAF